MIQIFFVYVGNRIDRIRHSTNSNLWNYVPSLLNPADDSRRGVTVDNLPISKCLNGPKHVLQQKNGNHGDKPAFPLVLPEEDYEVRALVSTLSKSYSLECHRFERFLS